MEYVDEDGEAERLPSIEVSMTAVVSTIEVGRDRDAGKASRGIGILDEPVSLCSDFFAIVAQRIFEET